ncbi:MAG: AAA family ATPase [Isosphaeraceae bacterium]
MLRELSVQNLALIEDARVELEPGYCAWTGETGAGKSLLLTALGLVLGGKASAELVREGKAQARASAVFEMGDARIREEVETILGGSLDGEPLILTRRVSSQGKGSASANGMPVAVGTLRQLAARLIDVHGQHESRDLIDPDRQRELLDAYGRLGDLLSEYRARREQHARLLGRRRALLEAADRRRREQDLLRHEHDELEAAEPRPGEYADLNAQAHRLANIGHFREAVAAGYARLYEAEKSAQGILEQVARSLGPHRGWAPEVDEAVGTLQRLADEVREVAYTLRRLGRDQADDPADLDEIEGRLALYRKLATRFRCEPDALADRFEAIRSQLEAIDRDEADLAALDAPLAEAWASLKAAARALSEGRRRASGAFSKAVQGRFKGLGLADARIRVEVEADPLGDSPCEATSGPDGADRVEILFAPNPGEPPRPLRRIASGGEMSRVTLAIKAVLAGIDRPPRWSSTRSIRGSAAAWGTSSGARSPSWPSIIR